MKTILLIGDSWGVPNYEGPNFGAEPHEHTEYLLRELGYKVYNCSLSGGSHKVTIDLARAYLAGETVTLAPTVLNNTYHKASEPSVIDTVNPKIDYIVWFHTEALRYFFHAHMSIEENLDFSYKWDYEYVSNFCIPLDAKLIAIGGQAPIYDKFFYDYFRPYYIIEDWRSEIVGIKLPKVYTLGKVEWIENSNDTLDNKLEVMKKHKVVLDAMSNCPYFPDTCHPGKEPHKKLTELLHTIF